MSVPVSKILSIIFMILGFSLLKCKEIEGTMTYNSNVPNDLKSKKEKLVEDSLELMMELVEMMEKNGELPKDNCNIAFIGTTDYYSLYVSQNPKHYNINSTTRSVISIPNLASLNPGRRYNV